MEPFGIGWLLRHYGSFGCLIWLFVVAVCGAIFGYRFAKQNSDLPKGDPRAFANIAKFTLFLWGIWLLAFGIHYWRFDIVPSGLGWFFYAALAACSACSLSLLFTRDEDCSLADSRFAAKSTVWMMSSVVVSVVTWMAWGGNAQLISLTKPEVASYIYARLVTEGEDCGWYYRRLQDLQVAPHPYFEGIAHAKLQDRGKASENFRSYADTLPKEKKALWLALGDFFRNDFVSAEKIFKDAGMDRYSLWSRFRNNQLSALDFNRFVESHSLGNEDLSFFANIKDVVISTDDLHDAFGQQKTTENATILAELQSLKKILQEMKEGNNTKKSDDAAAAATTLAQDSRTFEVKAKRVNDLRDKIDIEIERQMILLAVKHAPPLPFPDMARFADTGESWRNVFMVGGAFPFFLFCLIMVNEVWLEKAKGAVKFLRALAECIGLSPSRISKWGHHSATARSFAASIAKMEPEDEKGLFGEEILRIHAAVFPVDVLIAFRCHCRAKGILAAKHVEAQEQEDILFIHGAIRKLSGMLIPHGDEQALSIITALRDRSDEGLQKYRKGQMEFLPARDELLMIQKELTTLGDILDAFGAKPELTSYHLLGLEPQRGISDADVKQAYRSIMGAVHPDHNSNNKYISNLARMVIGAYATLSNPNRRAAYETAVRL